MRIIAGKFRGTALAAVGKGDTGAHLRPTSDRVRENLFNVLSKYEVLDGARVLDFFAGTGALGLEALSRGARHVTFVDDGKIAGQLIRQNVEKTRSQDLTDLIRRDARKLPQNASGPFDLVFLDPPYGKSLGVPALGRACSHGWISSGSLVVWEENAAQVAPAGFVGLESRRYGDTHVTILRAT